MTRISESVRAFVRDGEVDKAEAQRLVATLKADGKVSKAERKALANAVVPYRDAFSSAAFEVVKAFGAPAAEPIGSLSGRAELSAIASGELRLSSAKNRSDPAVRTIQRALMTLARTQGMPALGLPMAGADGVYGAETTAAVKTFQSAYGLTADGVVGRATLSRMAQVLASGDAPLVDAELQNARFKGVGLLEKVADGRAFLGAGSKGEPVKKLQSALVDLGYPLPEGGVDGAYGGETVHAVRQFQKDHGLRVTGDVDAATLRKLDGVSPAPGSQAVRFPEYQRMMKDGVLSTTIGVGYDEGGSDLWQRKVVLEGLHARGFERLDLSRLSDADLKAKGLDPAAIDREGTYFFKAFDFDGEPVKALVRYVDRYTDGAKDRFAAGFASDDLVLYGGHARYGSGPDFDEKESTAGNFVLGVNAQGHRTGALTQAYDAHMREILKNAPNDLERTELTDRYQMMFFSGCSTKHYLDELRGIPKNKDASNLDVIGSNEPLYWNKIGGNLLSALDAVMGGESVNDLQAGLTQYNDGAGFTADGFGGNTYKP